MSARYYASAYSINEPLNPAWSPEYLRSLKSTYEHRQYTKDALIDYIYSEPRRVRRQVQGPVEGYYHPNEINGVRIQRKGRGTPPQDNSSMLRSKQQQQSDNEEFPGFYPHRRAKPTPPASADSSDSNSAESLSRRLRSYRGCIYPVDHVEQLWPDKGRAKADHIPPEQCDQQWPTKGKRIIDGRSHMDHGEFFAWNPDTKPTAASTTTRPVIQQTEQQKCFGKRVAAQHNRSNIVLG